MKTNLFIIVLIFIPLLALSQTENEHPMTFSADDGLSKVEVYIKKNAPEGNFELIIMKSHPENGLQFFYFDSHIAQVVEGEFVSFMQGASTIEFRGVLNFTASLRFHDTYLDYYELGSNVIHKFNKI